MAPVRPIGARQARAPASTSSRFPAKAGSAFYASGLLGSSPVPPACGDRATAPAR